MVVNDTGASESLVKESMPLSPWTDLLVEFLEVADGAGPRGSLRLWISGAVWPPGWVGGTRQEMLCLGTYLSLGQSHRIHPADQRVLMSAPGRRRLF